MLEAAGAILLIGRKRAVEARSALKPSRITEAMRSLA
jgi:hypothetical protein